MQDVLAGAYRSGCHRASISGVRVVSASGGGRKSGGMRSVRERLSGIRCKRSGLGAAQTTAEKRALAQRVELGGRKGGPQQDIAGQRQPRVEVSLPFWLTASRR